MPLTVISPWFVFSGWTERELCTAVIEPWILTLCHCRPPSPKPPSPTCERRIRPLLVVEFFDAAAGGSACASLGLAAAGVVCDPTADVGVSPERFVCNEDAAGPAWAVCATVSNWARLSVRPLAVIGPESFT